jgi:hypothetical protein
MKSESYREMRYKEILITLENRIKHFYQDYKHFKTELDGIIRRIKNKRYSGEELEEKKKLAKEVYDKVLFFAKELKNNLELYNLLKMKYENEKNKNEFKEFKFVKGKPVPKEILEIKKKVKFVKVKDYDEFDRIEYIIFDKATDIYKCVFEGGVMGYIYKVKPNEYLDERRWVFMFPDEYLKGYIRLRFKYLEDAKNCFINLIYEKYYEKPQKIENKIKTKQKIKK